MYCQITAKVPQPANDIGHRCIVRIYQSFECVQNRLGYVVNINLLAVAIDYGYHNRPGVGQFRPPKRCGCDPHILPPLPQSSAVALQRYRGLVYDEFKRYWHLII